MKTKSLPLCSLALVVCGAVLAGAGEPPARSFDEIVSTLDHRGGLLDLYVDEAGGRVVLALPRPDADGTSTRVLYAGYLAAGLGSNPVNLDRGQQGDTLVLAFRREGPRVLVEAEDWGVRCTRRAGRRASRGA